ncbi:Scarecrow-like protein 14 [Abeliophyllum distichum]|uniref:Scarecrow-like protein 14 n=1 Tax=Abeliophyllum distichum TaxID=126358 RepID=A0ABD1Q537_9LAMI
MSYCKRFNVPFEYNAIAKKWDTISLEDLKIERDEMVVVNCLYRLRHVPDESAGLDSRRDDVLNLIRKINPDLFIHGIVNGTYNGSFFTSRFREALYHYSSLFDMLDNTIPREDHDRLLYEREEFGRDVMNVIACEGPVRTERPETYKKWQVRNLRAGFRQLPLNQDIVKEVKAKVRKGYNNDFLLDEDSDWMLQGWKGRVMYALSCWMPVRE